jgi:hypothetical protein
MNLLDLHSPSPYKGNNESEMETGHHRHHREEKTTMEWPHLNKARKENNKSNYGMDTTAAFTSTPWYSKGVFLALSSMSFIHLIYQHPGELG